MSRLSNRLSQGVEFQTCFYASGSAG